MNIRLRQPGTSPVPMASIVGAILLSCAAAGLQFGVFANANPQNKTAAPTAAAAIAKAPQAQPAVKIALKDKEHKKPAGKSEEIASAKAGKDKGKPKEEPAEILPPVLDPSQFFGEAQIGYASAKQAPEVMAKLFCYCGCDISDKHSRLLDCYATTHGIDCHICQEEAALALRLHRDGESIANIQRQIDSQYSHYYPFTEESAALKKYKATRLYKTGDSPSKPDEKAGPLPKSDSQDSKVADEKDKDNSGKPKLKPGHSIGKCCGHGEHKETNK